MTRSWKRKDTGEDFYDTSFKGNIVDYILSGIKERSWADERDENFLVSDERIVKDENEKEKLLRFIHSERDGFKCGGVLSIKGEEGYRILKNEENGIKIMQSIKRVLSEHTGISEKEIHFVSGIHKNTVDRHIHFLFFSREKEKKSFSLKRICEEIRNMEADEMIPGIKKEKREEDGYNLRRISFLSGTMDFARNISRSGIKMKSLESLPLTIREEIRAYASDLMKMKPENKEKDMKIREKIKENILLEKGMDEAAEEYFSDSFYLKCEEDVFMLIKSTSDSFRKTASSAADKGVKKDILKEIVKRHAKTAERIIKENGEIYGEKLDSLLHRLSSEITQGTGEIKDRDKISHIEDVSH